MSALQVIDSHRMGVAKLMFDGGWEGTYLDVGDSSKFVVCVSTMYGCPVRCSFCHLTELGLYRDWHPLSAEAIAQQVTLTLRHQSARKRIPSARDCVVSFMGMGEPLLNLDNLLASIPLIEADGAAYIDGRFRYDLATVLPKGTSLRDIPTEARIRLFFSLHSALDVNRHRLIPQARPLDEAFAELVAYHQRTGVKPIVNHCLIDGVNDGADEVEQIKELFSMPEHRPFQLRLLRYNPYSEGEAFLSAHHVLGVQRESRRLLEIIEELEKVVNVKIHRSPGYDVKAACGQFAGSLID